MKRTIDIAGDEAWKLGLKKYYGASTHRKAQQLAVDTECVANGLKPAYLLDALAPDACLFHSFLNHTLCKIMEQSGTHRSALIQKWISELRVVSVASDVLLVINMTGVQNLFWESSQTCIYVDINNTKAGGEECMSVCHSPAIEEQCRQWYTALVAADHQQQQQQPETHDSRGGQAGVKLLSVPPLPDMNLCTLFGRLLGYPVVYWFPPSTSYDLDFVKLIRHQVTISKSCGTEKVLEKLSEHCVGINLY